MLALTDAEDDAELLVDVEVLEAEVEDEAVMEALVDEEAAADELVEEATDEDDDALALELELELDDPDALLVETLLVETLEDEALELDALDVEETELEDELKYAEQSRASRAFDRPVCSAAGRDEPEIEFARVAGMTLPVPEPLGCKRGQ